MMIFLAEEKADYLPLSVDPDERDATVEVLSAALLPASASRSILDSIRFAGWMKKHLAGLAVHAASGFVENRRGRYTDQVIGKTGDILLYQARGEHIRTFIRDCIMDARQTDSNIVLLAHSLGGIASLDLLVLDH